MKWILLMASVLAGAWFYHYGDTPWMTYGGPADVRPVWRVHLRGRVCVGGCLSPDRSGDQGGSHTPLRSKD